MKRRILLVDDEVAILLTLQAVLEINGFEVETAASAREAKLKIRSNQYHMVITDMRMENESAGSEVVLAARKSSCRPAVAMLTAFPLADSGDGENDADEVLVKPMNTNDLLLQIEALLVTHEDKKRIAEERNLQLAAGAVKQPAGKNPPSRSKANGPAKSFSSLTETRRKAPVGKKAAARRKASSHKLAGAH
jgi:DNA-binding response OmpR family regulator